MELSSRLAVEDLKKMGYTVMDVSENSSRKFRNRYISRTNDRFSCFDVVAVDDRGWILIQSTAGTGGHASHRRKKVDENFPVSPPNTRILVWEYIPKKEKAGNRRENYIKKEYERVNGRWVDGDGKPVKKSPREPKKRRKE